MNKRNLYNAISIFFAIITFVLLIWILLSGGSGISFATFAFWTLIVGINAVVTIKEKGNFVFPLILTLGNFSISIVLLLTKQFWWGLTEWFTLILVLISLIVSMTSSRTMTMFISTIAITLASIPQLILTWNNPTLTPISAFVGFGITSFFGILAGKEWSIKERLYPIARMFMNILVIIFSMKRFI